MQHGQTKVGYHTTAIVVHQYIFRLKISMSNGRFPFGTVDFRVQMHQSAGNGQTNHDHIVMRQCRTIQVIEQWSLRIEMRQQPQLGARISRRHVAANVTQNIFMSQQNRAEK